MTIQTFTPDSTGSTASRPSSPGVGWRHWNTDTAAYEVWDGASWLDISSTASGVVFHTSGSFVADNTNNRTIVTGIPGGATLISVDLGVLPVASHGRWERGWDSFTDDNTTFAISVNGFTPSGVNFIVGATNFNAGSATVEWNAYYTL